MATKTGLLMALSLVTNDQCESHTSGCFYFKVSIAIYL